MSLFCGSVEKAMESRPHWCFIKRMIVGGHQNMSNLKSTIARMQDAGHDIVLAQKGLFGMTHPDEQTKFQWISLFNACNATGPDLFVCAESNAVRLMFLIQHREWVTRTGCKWQIQS